VKKLGRCGSLLLLAFFVKFTPIAVAQSPGTFASTGNLINARYSHTATMLNNGEVLIAGGDGSSGVAIAGAELYNATTGTFSSTGNLIMARYSHTATLLNNGEVLIVGGDGSSGAAIASSELYNPTAGTFSSTGSLITARYSHTATLLSNGEVLITGGYSASGTALASAEVYNPSTGAFASTGSLTTARYDHTATLLPNSGMVLIAGGVATSGADVEGGELYNPVTSTFSTVENSEGQSGHTAALLNSGNVLIAGGQSGGASELFNPTAGSFAATGSENAGDFFLASALLTNGTVLIAGGFNYFDGPNKGSVAAAALYTTASGTFSSTGSLKTARNNHTATLLSNGKVLVAGGFTYHIATLATAELYEPTTVTPPNLESISLEPTGTWVPVGGTLGFIATGTFSGSPAATLVSVIWSSSNSAVATVTNDVTNSGHVFGVAGGSATIEACAGSICGSTLVSIAPHTNLVVGSSAGAGAIWETRDDSGNFVNQGTLSNSRSSHSATLLANGTVFLAGGQDAPGTWQILTPTGQALSSGSLLNDFSSHLAVRLANGNVFLGGGLDSPGAWEIHSPTGTLLFQGSLLGSRTPGAGAVALQNGNIWIAASGSCTSRCDESTWEIRDINGKFVTNGTLQSAFASGKQFLLSNGNVLLIGGAISGSDWEIHSQTGAFVTSGTLKWNSFDSSSGAVFVNNQVFLFEDGYSEFIEFDSNNNVTFDTNGPALLDSRVGAKGVVTSTGNFFITGGSAAPGTWEMYRPNGTTVTFVSNGNLFDAHSVGHSDTHF